MNPLFKTMTAALALTTIICIAGCGDEAPEPQSNYVRLVDMAQDAVIESFIDLTDKEFALRKVGEPLVIENFERFDASIYTVQPVSLIEALRTNKKIPDNIKPILPTLSGKGENRRLVLNPRQAFLGILPVVKRRTHQIEILLKSNNLEGAWIAVLELGDKLTPGDLLDMTKFQASFARAGSLAHSLKPIEKLDNGYERYSLTLNTIRNTTRSLMFTVTSSEKPVAMKNLSVTLPTLFMDHIKFRASEFNHPYVRRINVVKDFRESIIFVAPGKASFKVKLPSLNPKLFFSVCIPDYAKAPDLEACAIATAGSIKVEKKVVLKKPPDGERPKWIDAELDLSQFAGKEIDLSLTAKPKRKSQTGIGVAFGGPVIIGDSSKNEQPPDVILISLDTMRADRMSLYGAVKPTTPFMDQLAKSSMVFEAAIAPATYTLPSHASMLTGQMPDSEDHLAVILCG